jgi:tRNA-dihydrouridine synthase A
MAFEHPISIAPMMDRTDRHYRWMMRLISRRVLLYTEMITPNAIIFGDREKLLGHDQEAPVALQLGGDDAEALAQAAKIGQEWGYTEINLNIGCPSDRVQSGNFGACLMKTPDVVARAVESVANAVDVEVTVKHRIGVDDLDRYEDMLNFVDTVAASGCKRFSVHARKAWLQGLSPKENRDVPPLRYEEVYRLKQEHPELDIEINGGIKTLDDAQTHLEHVDAVMIGRAAYDHPYMFADVDRRFYGDDHEVIQQHDIVSAMADYAEKRLVAGDKLNSVTRHMLHLFSGQPGARAWRRHLSENVWRAGASPEVLLQALEFVRGAE